MTFLPRRVLASLASLLLAAQAHAFEAGWMQIQTAGATPDAPTTTVALYYPTMPQAQLPGELIARFAGPAHEALMRLLIWLSPATVGREQPVAIKLNEAG